jgi:uncharacterized membrane protein YdjX (TVP38/TMEM64 family)
MDKSRELLAAVLLVAAVFTVLILTGNLEPALSLFLNPEYLKQVLEPYGFYAAFILIGLLLLNNILWPIPGHGLGVACGLIFGVFWGTVVCMIGTTLSTVIAVLISKKWGRPAARKILGKEKFQKYEHMASSRDIWPFVIFILVPVIPDDATAYLGGLTDLETWRLIFVMSLARFPGALTLIVFGDGVADASYVTMGGIAAMIAVISAFSIWKRDWILDKAHRTHEDQ